jgi:hypothetical protein
MTLRRARAALEKQWRQHLPPAPDRGVTAWAAVVSSQHEGRRGMTTYDY